MMKILNLTQHTATPAQMEAGVVDAPAEWNLSALLTFDTLPDEETIEGRAEAIASLASRSGHDHAMIGGALWLMGPLAQALADRAVRPLFAFSLRRSVDQPQPDGSVRKVAVFEHAGFVPAVLRGAGELCRW